MSESICQFSCQARSRGKYQNYCWIHFIKTFKVEPEEKDQIESKNLSDCKWECQNTIAGEKLCAEHFKRRFPTKSINDYDLDGEEIILTETESEDSLTDISIEDTLSEDEGPRKRICIELVSSEN